MTYTEFAKKMIVALYYESDGDTSLEVKFNSLFQKYAISAEKPFWIENLKSEWTQLGLATFPEDGTGRRETAVITISGVRNAESMDPSVLPKITAEIGPNDVTLYPVAPSASTAPTFVQTPLPADFPQSEPEASNRASSARMEASLVAEFIPAANRLVRLDHNQPAYVEIANGLISVREAVRELNDSSVDPNERQRVLASFDAAQVLWKSLDLKIIQLRVGILMTLEDAVNILGSTAKAVFAALLIETFKAFIKNHVGIDLDAF